MIEENVADSLPITEIQNLLQEHSFHLFEEQLSGIKKGEITAPFKSTFGWHIVRLIEKDAIEPFADLQPILQQKIAKDSRGEYSASCLD